VAQLGCRMYLHQRQPPPLMGNTFEYNGSGAQTVSAFTYNILIISNAGDKTILAGTTVNCFNITLNDAAVLVMPDTSVLNVQE
jgi:hypothetical protein